MISIQLYPLSKCCCSVCQHLTQSCSVRRHPCSFSAVIGQLERWTTCRRWGQKVSWCRATAWLTLHPQLKVSNGKSLHMPPHVLCLKRGNSCFLLLCVRLIYPHIANLWIYGFPVEKDTFVLKLSPWQVLLCRTYKREALKGRWIMGSVRKKFMFKVLINDDLKLAWTEQVLSFPQPSFKEVPDKFQCFFLYEYGAKLYRVQFA